MRRAVILGLVVVAAAVAIWKLACNHSSDDATTVAAGSSAGSASHDRASKPPATPASLSGRVTNSGDHAGIAGATVAIVATDRALRMGPPGAESPSTVATSDRNGAWSVPSIAPGTYVVTAAAVGFVPATTDKLVVAAGERKDHVDLALAAGGTLVTGTVTDVGGGAIAGVRVTMRKGGIFSRASRSDEAVTLTASDGTYKITLADGDWSANATHDDYAHSIKSFRLAGVAMKLDFVLVPGGVVRGQVVTRDGQPVASAVVTARGERRRFDSYATATADADGKFALKGLGTGALSLTASARGYASKAPTAITLGIGEQVDNVKVVVDHAFSISGTVVAKGTKQGIASVRVGAFTMASGDSVSGDPTEADGSFELVGVRPSSYLLFAMGEGVMPEMGKNVEVVDKDVTGVVVEMSAGVTLSGKVDPPVVASLHLEIDSAKISMGNAMEAAKAYSVSGDSDANGAFVLHNAPPGVFSIVATHADGRTGKLAINIEDKDIANLVVPLEARASIAGKVIDASGAAVVGVRVAVSAANRDTMSIRFDRGMREGVVTGVDGAFKVVGLDAGKVTMTVRDDQGKLAWAHPDKPVELDVAAGQAITGVTLTIESRDGTIRGQVVGSDQKPTPDAWVLASYQEAGEPDVESRIMRLLGNQLPVLTGSDGRFTLDHLRHGTYKIVVEGPRGASRAEANNVKIGDDVTITLAALGTLSGRVTANGAPVKTYDLACRTSKSTSPMSMMPGMPEAIDQQVSADDGTYSVEHVIPGSYDCTITSDAGTAKDALVIPTGPMQHDFALVAYGSVTGVVVDATTNKPLADLLVMNMQPGNSRAMTQILSGQGPKTDANGRFALDLQPLGTGRLIFMATTIRMPLTPTDPKQASFTLTAGQHLDLGTIKVGDMQLPPSDAGVTP